MIKRKLNKLPEKINGVTVVQDCGMVELGINKYRERAAKFLCPCGDIFMCAVFSVKSGNTKTCGCTRYKNLLLSNIKHGKSRDRIYYIWIGMKKRCNNEKCKSYKYYGGRGIKVCDEWSKDFMKFYKWSINNGYEKTLTIDRINNEKGYSPSNCRWATRLVQSQNRRISVNTLDINPYK